MTFRQEPLQFVLSPIHQSSKRRVFFVEGKSGWGKSSLIAQLRVRLRNKRYKNQVFLLAVDSRSANTPDFVSLAFAKLAKESVAAGFIPDKYLRTNITSSYDILASSEVQGMLSWLRNNRKVLVLVFDQFEDIFRKEDLFRTFHKLMLDTDEGSGNLVVGFSWKSDISIPLDNPAYSLWQQARDRAREFKVDEFLGFEIDNVIKQLESESGHKLPLDLKRRLKESSQGFPWLIKKLSIHCYHQMKNGVLPEELIDKKLNVKDLFDGDMESLNPEQTRALRIIAERSYDGEPFDVIEVDDKIQQKEIEYLLAERLIVRSGSKYNVYWDIFRDFLVKKEIPVLEESFLLRQFPKPCVRTLEYLIKKSASSIEDISQRSSRSRVTLKEGTSLNLVRELRNLGVVIREKDKYRVIPSIKTTNDFKNYMYRRLSTHKVIVSLQKLTNDVIVHEDIVNTLKNSFRGYDFSNKTWSTYANFFLRWMQYCDIDFGRRLSPLSASKKSKTGIESFTPQWRPERDLELFSSFRDAHDPLIRPINSDKGLYDLKNLGLVNYEGKYLKLTKKGTSILNLSGDDLRKEFAKRATTVPKIAVAYAAYRASLDDSNKKFESQLSSLLDPITSKSYRFFTSNVLKAWARFISENLNLQEESAQVSDYRLFT